MLELLLLHRPYLDSRDSAQRTPLLLAIFNNNFAIVRRLLYYGASPWTLLDYSYVREHTTPQILALLKIAKKIYITLKLQSRARQRQWFAS